jgi:serine/threonine protein kinase
LGEFFVALDHELNREVVLKEMQKQDADDPDTRRRFLREAQLTGGLEHPGIMPVYGLGCYSDGRPFYAMRLVRGESLQKAIERYHEADSNPHRDPGERNLALRELLRRFVEVCCAVAYAHSRGVIHQDLKPANVMLGDYGETLIIEWGLAWLLGEPVAEQIPMGQVMGTPAYMSPEQAEERRDLMGPCRDVFSLGATLYTLLTGQPPYYGEDVLGQARLAAVVPARQRKRSVPAALEAVCARAMARRPEDRYPNVRTLSEDVQRWLADEAVQAYSEPLAARLWRWGRRNRSVVVAGVALLAGCVLGLSVGLRTAGM